MSIQQLTDIEYTFSKNLQIIKDYALELPKAQKLRITAWLKKLCSVVDNLFWRKNRNLYAQTLAIMLQAKVIEVPFDKFPPEGSLAKLNMYEIPFWIREKLQETSTHKVIKKSNKQNMDTENKICREPKMKHYQSVMSELPNLRLKKKQSQKFKSLQAPQIPDSVDMHFISGENDEENDYQEAKTRRKNPNLTKQRQKSQEIMNSIQKVLYFLAKNNNIFQNDQRYRSIMQEIVQYGDEAGINFRLMKFSIICE